jgi:hypothetical protein
LLMIRALLLRRGEHLRAGQPHHPWPMQGWALPPRAADAGGASARDVGAMASPTIIDADPISAVPGRAEDLVRDQPQIDLAPGGPETSGAQVPPSSSSSPRLPRRTINWNHTSWQEDWFEDNDDMQALRTSIVTIKNALTVSCP